MKNECYSMLFNGFAFGKTQAESRFSYDISENDNGINHAYHYELKRAYLKFNGFIIT